ncbi:MAG: LptF/LptG family permease [Paludibacter sp.]|nr:LptF/LptG family permease [Paludibacter sp.]
MFQLKKIDSYIFKRFFTLFLMTFLICIFILLMQFLWKHVTELVGKGVGWSVLSEFFIYAVFSLIPMALPLAILLASLMTFGNLGENFELSAMKSAGISLFRIMRPLIIFISFVCVGAFFFSNYVLPISQTKLWTLIISLREKSPEFDIPVGEFYSGINGINIYVREKEKHLLKNLMIYDFSGGFENATVMVADSGRVQFTLDKKYILLSLYDGESFANLTNQRISSSASSIPYRRETFKTKDILIDFDSGFNRFSESMLQDQHVSKNLKQLTQSIDSVSKIATSTSRNIAKGLINQHFFGRDVLSNIHVTDSLKKDKKILNADSLFLSLNQESMVRVGNSALDKAKSMKDQVTYNKVMLDDPVNYVIRHEIERHRKFTLSFACLIFFFIGAPLGAIIRKGGLGMPVVISVIMFIIYYIIDNTGYKMARESIWPTYEGMWLSSFVLLPIGIFLTYKSVVDATIFNAVPFIKIWNVIKIKYNTIRNK